MNQRRLFPERTNLYPKDIRDQLPGKYIAFVINTHGEKMAFTCDHIEIAPAAILFSRTNTVALTGSDPKANRTLVAACAADADWAFIERDRFIELTGEEYKLSETADAKAFSEMMERIVGGKDAVVKIVSLPSGKMVPLPASEEEIEKYRQEAKKDEKKPYEPGSGIYV